jgi:cytochrome c oxidase cbb3-type subunit 4
MDAGLWRGIYTVVMLVLFIGVWAWAWSAKRKSVFDAAAQMPLEDEEAGRSASARAEETR